ncbi:MAG: SH3 domain-containing protein, partial [Aquificae bacterium]|nr:SH3 domain-containing protein [Aquificota bacterium]
IKFTLEIKPITPRELEILFERYIKLTDKPIQKNKEITRYIYELTKGKLGEIFESLEKLNDLVYFFSLKIAYKEKIKYLSIFLVIFIAISAFLTFLLFYLEKEKEPKTQISTPISEKAKNKINTNQFEPIPSQPTKSISTDEPPKNISQNQREELQTLAFVSGSIVNVREKPTLDSKIVGKLKKLQTIKILEYKDQWVKIKYKDLTGWVKKDYIKTVPEGFAVVKAHYLNIREKPTKNSKVLYRLKAGDIVKLLNERKGRWVKVIYEINGKKIQGWVSKIYLLEGKTTQTGSLNENVLQDHERVHATSLPE